MRVKKRKPDLTSIMVETHDFRFPLFYWQTLEAFVPLKTTKKGTLLDLGTGPGLFVRDIISAYPNLTATGVDESEAMVSYAKQMKLPRARAKIYKRDISSGKTNLKDRPFDFITMNFVFHHLPSPLSLLDNLKHNLLSKNGYFIIYDWVRTSLEDYVEFHKLMGRNMPEDAAFEMFSEHGKYGEDDLEWLLGREGFKLENKESITALHSLMVFKKK